MANLKTSELTAEALRHGEKPVNASEFFAKKHSTIKRSC